MSRKMPKKKVQHKMDRFIVKNPQPSPSNSPSKTGAKRMTQSTIESLKGVVVIDDILRHKSMLLLSTATREEKLESLQELSKKIPPRHVMLSTKIGKVVKKLCCHDDTEIKKAAKRLYVQWKSHFVEHAERPMMEVQCDLKTETLRKKGRTLLTEALEGEDHAQLAETIEREAFLCHKRFITNGYRRSMRNLVFMLRNQADVRCKVISGEITVTDFVKDNKKS